MKKYKASDLSHKRAEVMKEARNGGVIIQECRTNGEVMCEYVIIEMEHYKYLDRAEIKDREHISRYV